MCVSSRNPLPFFTRFDASSSDGEIVCRRVSTGEQLRLGWRLIRLLRLLESAPIIP